MKNGIIYTRVSTDEQATMGYSLNHQKAFLETYCTIKNINILMHFKEDYSAKNFNRPEFTKLMEYCRTNRKSVDQILFTRWDRFSRNAKESYKMIEWFEKKGIELIALEQLSDTDNPEYKLILALNLIMPEIENDKNSIRTIEGTRRAQKEGYWTQRAPFGYHNTRDDSGHSTLQPNEDAILVKEAFELYSTGIYTMEEVRRRLKSRGLKVNKQVFNRLLKRVSYIGKIKMRSWKNEGEEIVDGAHDPIISEELYYRVQAIIKKRRPNKPIRKKYNNNLPLRGHLICDECSNVMTGSGSKGRGGIYYYYHCQRGCKTRFRADESNEKFIDYLSGLKVKNEVAILYKEAMKDVVREKEGDISSQILQIEKRLLKNQNLLENAQDKYFSGEVDSITFNDAKKRYKNKINSLNRELSNLKIDETHFDTHLNYTFNLLQDIDFYYVNASAEVKHRILGSIFPEKLIYSDKKYRTPKPDSVITLIAHVENVVN